jgi:CRP-like cAMP-binding protein
MAASASDQEQKRISAMAKSRSAPNSLGNRLLDCLPRPEGQRLLARLQLVSLKFEQVLSEPDAEIDWVFFPTLGVISDVTILKDGKKIEVATIGNEGFVGLCALLGGKEWTSRMIVQVPGKAYRMEHRAFVAETKVDAPLRQVLAHYHPVYLKQLAQSVACNGVHSAEQRCCRWLLMTHDRVEADEFPLTHELLSHMLGVRRVTVTDVLRPLHKAGVIHNGRGTITILKRKALEAKSCECYRNIAEEFARMQDSGADRM